MSKIRHPSHDSSTAPSLPHFSQSASSRSPRPPFLAKKPPVRTSYQTSSHLNLLSPSIATRLQLFSSLWLTSRYLFHNVPERPQTIHARRGRHLCHQQSRRCRFFAVCRLRPAEVTPHPIRCHPKTILIASENTHEAQWDILEWPRGTWLSFGELHRTARCKCRWVFGLVSANLI